MIPIYVLVRTFLPGTQRSWGSTGLSRSTILQSTPKKIFENGVDLGIPQASSKLGKFVILLFIFF